MRRRWSVIAALVFTSVARRAVADVVPHPLFTDHAVLQQGANIPVWGTADPGEAVTVHFAAARGSDQTVATTASRDGKWSVRLAPVQAAGPFTLTIAGKNTVVLGDILVGEVWLCGGQSNMERQLGPRVGQQPITDWEKEVAGANYPRIRHFGVAQEKSLTPLSRVSGRWEICTPDAVKGFSAVGYFFGRALHRARHVPVGLIHASWGGTPAEAWTSEAGLRQVPDFADAPAQLQLLRTDPAAARRAFEARLETWFAARDAGSAAGGAAWSAPALSDEGWKVMAVPGLWETAGEPDLNGVVWFRKTFDLPARLASVAAELRLGMVDDIDTTWVNGVKVGATFGYNLERTYPVPAGVLQAGRNVVAVRVLDTGGGGGIWGAEPPRVRLGAQPAIELAGPWQYRIGLDLRSGPWPPTGITGDVATPSVLYNGMIAPLVPYAIRGVIFYQGEANVRRERQYQTVFPALIADWRRAWGDELPFLFVQIAPHRDMTPELREAQVLSWQRTPKTAMVGTDDCGDANDIHPPRKQPVGARLALAARAIAYGEKLEFAGPLFDGMRVAGHRAVVRFTHVGGGLVARGERLTGFTVAGGDGIHHPAVAIIRGRAVVVTSDRVPQPVAVRYAWANVPDGNLFNRVGLPASPFRTDPN